MFLYAARHRQDSSYYLQTYKIHRRNKNRATVMRDQGEPGEMSRDKEVGKREIEKRAREIVVKWKESGNLFFWMGGGGGNATRMRIDEVHRKEESFHQQVWQMKLGDKSPTGRSLGFQFLYWLLLSFCRLPNSPASGDKWLHLSLRLLPLPPTFSFIAKRVWEFPDYKSAGWLAGCPYK